MCQNGTDHVNLERLVQFKPLLGLDNGGSIAHVTNSDAEWVAAGLLRLANNHLEDALDRYQGCQRNLNVVFEQVAALDASQGVVRPSRCRRTTPVDDMALALLQSMGIHALMARRALELHGNDVEGALAWVTTTATQISCSSSSPADEESMHSNGSSSPPALRNEEDEEVNSSGATTGQGGLARSAGVGAMDDDEDKDQDEHVKEEKEHPSQDTERAANMLRQQQEAEAADLLEQVLGEALGGQQHTGDDEVLGSSLDEEWHYLEMFREKYFFGRGCHRKF